LNDESYWVRASTLNRDQPAFAALVERVRTEPNAVLADPLDVVVLADRPPLLEPVLFSIFELDGRWSSDALISRICDGGVGLLVLNMPLEAAATYVPYGIPWWPVSVMRALTARMIPAGQVAGRFLYVPDQSPGSAQKDTTTACSSGNRSAQTLRSATWEPE
jgi:hypothetical protein